ILCSRFRNRPGAQRPGLGTAWHLRCPQSGAEQPAVAYHRARPKPVLDSVTTFIAGLSTGRPQVLLDVQVYQIDQTLLRNLGVQIPTQFQMIQIPPSVIALLSQGNIQQQIQNLINSGGLTPENLQAIQALLAQLQAQQASGLSSLLNQPFITFGHGQTLFAITYPGSFTANFRFDNSTVRQLEHIT